MKTLLKNTFPILYEKAWRVRGNFYRNQRLKKLYEERREIMRNYDTNLFYLNIGSSRFVRKNWRLLDYYALEKNSQMPEAMFREDLLDFNINLIPSPRLPISDNSVDLLYSGHCLEHIGDAPAQNIFNEAYRILKQGGKFRVVLPDADLAYDAYKRNDIEWFRGIKKQRNEDWNIEKHYFCFVSGFYFLNPKSAEEVRKDLELLSQEAFFEKYHNEYYDPKENAGHITWFNFDKVKKMAEKSGFVDIRLSSSHQSISEEMRAPEFDNHEKLSFFVDMVR